MGQAIAERLSVDCDEIPSIPHGWRILPEDQLPNTVRGKFDLDFLKIGLHLHSDQMSDRKIRGDWLIEYFRKMRRLLILPANVLDFLLQGENQHLIPEEWRGKDIFFWGTIYRDLGGGRFIRCLQFNGEHWTDSYRWVTFEFPSYSPAAILDEALARIPADTN